MARAPVPIQTPAQRENRRISQSISKDWRISRQDKRPRGLKNGRNNCYRHGLLQNLLHLPRFLNWIRQHNVKGQNWPCNPRLLTQVDDNVFSTLVNHANARLIKRCVPCLLKDLVVAYWGTDDKDKDSSGDRNDSNSSHAGSEKDEEEPDLAAFPHEHTAMLPVHRFAERFFCRKPDNHDAVLASNKNKNKSQVSKKALSLRMCQDNMTAQQDAQELMTHILGWGCEQSLETPVKRNHRLNQYRALFQTVYNQNRVCSGCGYTTEKTVVNFGQQVTPLTEDELTKRNMTEGNDSLQDAFARAMEAESLTSNDDPDGDKTKNNWVRCSECKAERVDLNATMRIQSAPEYMCIHVNLFAKNPAGESIKNRNTMRIPDILDLTQHVQTVNDRPPAPLRYKLIDVVYHEGTDLNYGHYVAGVTGPESISDIDPANPLNQFLVNDSHVHPWSNTAGTNVLTANPAEHNDYYKSQYDPYLLFYEYIPNAKGSTKGKRDIPLVADIKDDSSIAERVRKKNLSRNDRGMHDTRKKREEREGKQ